LPQGTPRPLAVRQTTGAVGVAEKLLAVLPRMKGLGYISENDYEKAEVAFEPPWADSAALCLFLSDNSWKKNPRRGA